MGSHGKARQDTIQALEARAPFRRSGFAMWATREVPWDTGWMPLGETETYRAHRSAGEITYVVMSYDTPIAYVLADGTVIQSQAKHSPTTSQHMGLARFGLRER